jgi:L-alanine-DL-glutamate epimerase-like enolase superfamily enzyme
VADNGDLMLPKQPGLGFRFDDAAIERYGVVYPGTQERWQTVR